MAVVPAGRRGAGRLMAARAALRIGDAPRRYPGCPTRLAREQRAQPSGEVLWRDGRRQSHIASNTEPARVGKT
jgi:hypothetical protein